MAEVALPILALGGLYIYSNSEKNKPDKKLEKYTNMGEPQPQRLPNTHIANKNFPKQNQPIDSNNENYIRQFINPNQTTDKFFKNDISKKMLNKNIADKEFKSISGDCFTAKNFTHNNMVPFFGSKVTQASPEINVSSLLDNAQGAGSQLIKKVEAAPLFKPAENVQLAHGAPVQTNFLQSRQIPSTRVANVLPWEQQKVAPGLGLGYTTDGAGGFNSGMLDRESWLPPSVNDLRVKTNPRVTYSLAGREGPATAEVKNAGTIGKMEKNRPDTDFKMGPQHWLTTTGSQIAPRQYPEQMMQQTNSCSTEYYGVSNNSTHQGIYTKPNIEQPHRIDSQEIQEFTPASATGHGPGINNNYGKHGYNVNNNNRNQNCKSQNNSTFGAVNGAVKSMMAPLMDILRPTRKEDIIYNANQLGNIQASVPNLPLTNPNDKPKTTNKEMTAGKIGLNYLNVSHINANSGGAYQNTDVSVKSQQRNFGDSSNFGNVGNTIQQPMDISAWNEQHNNVNKTYENWPMAGGTQLWNANINMNISKHDNDRVNNRLTSEDFIKVRPTSADASVPSARALGAITMPQQFDQTINSERINPDILQAFKTNPYAQSLNSF